MLVFLGTFLTARRIITVHNFSADAHEGDEYADFRYDDDDLHPNGGPAEEREGA